MLGNKRPPVSSLYQTYEDSDETLSALEQREEVENFRMLALKRYLATAPVSDQLTKLIDRWNALYNT